MARLRQLEKALGAAFKAPTPKKPDMQRRQREEAKTLAGAHGIEIEKFSEGGGMNVWPPRSLDDALDPFAGDHHASDWSDALEMVKQYAALMPSTNGNVTAVANDEACIGDGCERKDACMRRTVLRGNVPCFPVADHLCSPNGDDAFIQLTNGHAAAVPALHR